MKRKSTYTLLILFVIGIPVLWAINICNFSSLSQINNSISLFGLNPYSACISHVVPDSLNIYRKIKNLFSKFSNQSNSLTNSISDRSGKDIYLGACESCNSMGLLDAPNFGDNLEWEKLKDKGLDSLLKSTIEGLRGMPEKGACTDCSQEELLQAVKYLVEGKEKGLDTNKGNISKLDKLFEVDLPQTRKGKAVTYKINNIDSKEENVWYRSHGNNENTKFFIFACASWPINSSRYIPGRARYDTIFTLMYIFALSIE